MDKFKNKTAIVTGASKGLGVLISKYLAERGTNIIGIARDEKQLKKVCDSINSSGGKAKYYVMDLSRVQDIADGLGEILKENGPVHYLVNNAGVEQYRKFQDYDPAMIDKMIAVNLQAPLETSRVLLPHLLEHGGHIVNIASLGGKKGIAYNSIYSATKSGLIMWTDAMRQELSETKVNISVICPGYIADTGMFYNAGQDPPRLLGTSKPERVAQAVIKAIEKNSAEIIVNHGPIKPLLSLAQVFPRLGDFVVKIFGVPQMSYQRTLQD